MWLPLEANPDIMNTYIKKLGAEGEYSFCDVFGTDAELLVMVPQPVLAIVLLFPITVNSEQHKKDEDERIKKDGQFVNDKVYFTKQTVETLVERLESCIQC